MKQLVRSLLERVCFFSMCDIFFHFLSLWQIKHDNPSALDSLLKDITRLTDSSDSFSDSQRIESIEAELAAAEANVQTLTENVARLRETLVRLEEFRAVLEANTAFFRTADVFQDDFCGVDEEDGYVMMTSWDKHRDTACTANFITGVVSFQRAAELERVVWRALHGNVYVRTEPISEKYGASGGAVFVVFYHGSHAREKVLGVCTALGARLYDCPASGIERVETVERVYRQAREVVELIERSEQAISSCASEVAGRLASKALTVWQHMACYRVLSECEYRTETRCLLCEGWCPSQCVDEVKRALDIAQRRSGTHISAITVPVGTAQAPPTYFPTTPFTKQFQSVVDAYGVPRYGEVNPCPFTVVTLPFLFAVMFGDAGHGLLLCTAALALIAAERRTSAVRWMNDVLRVFVDGRYVILLMGVFSVFTGTLYNEFFSMSANVFGSLREHRDGAAETVGAVYPFGVDPAWRQAANELSFSNSLKMKLAIIFGVVQITLGVVLSALNLPRHGWARTFWLRFVPKLLLVGCFLWYPVFLILYKWLAVPRTPSPMLVSVVVNMLLKYAAMPESDRLYTGQNAVQTVLTTVGGVALVVLVAGTPLSAVLRRERTPQVDGYVAVEESPAPGAPAPDSGEDAVSELVDGIEFVLGCVSGTASYLRLWALSLAHSGTHPILHAFFPFLPVPRDGVACCGELFVALSHW